MTRERPELNVIRTIHTLSVFTCTQGNKIPARVLFHKMQVDAVAGLEWAQTGPSVAALPSPDSSLLAETICCVLVSLSFADLEAEASQTAGSDPARASIIGAMQRRCRAYGSERTQYFRVHGRAQKKRTFILKSSRATGWILL